MSDVSTVVQTPKKKKKKQRKPAHVIKPSDREHRFVKLRSLKCFDEVHQHILEGWPVSKVAEWVQEERKEYTEASREGLTSMLRKYRDSIPPAQLIRDQIPRKFIHAAEQVDESLDELSELERLYMLQMDRIGLEMKTERAIGKLFPSMTQEIRTAREILSTIAELKMDLGVNSRKIGRLDVNAELVAKVESQGAAPQVAVVLANPESRQRLLSAANKLLKQGAKELPIDTEGVEVKPDSEAEEPPLEKTG